MPLAICIATNPACFVSVWLVRKASATSHATHTRILCQLRGPRHHLQPPLQYLRFRICTSVTHRPTCLISSSTSESLSGSCCVWEFSCLPLQLSSWAVAQRMSWPSLEGVDLHKSKIATTSRVLYIPWFVSCIPSLGTVISIPSEGFDVMGTRHLHNTACTFIESCVPFKHKCVNSEMVKVHSYRWH